MMHLIKVENSLRMARRIKARMHYPAVFLLISSCAVGPDYQPLQNFSPERWQGSEERGERNPEQLAQWWQQFHDATLDALVNDAIAANLDLKTARAQLREARARRDIASGNRGPSVSVSASGSRGKGSTVSGGGITRNLYNAGFDASWEPDIFGGLRRDLEAAEADWQASAERLHNTRVSLVAEVARNYIELRAAEKRLAVAEASMTALAETSELTQWRYKAGIVSGLDVIQARTLLEQTRAGMPVLRTAIEEARHRLAILLGLSPGSLNERLQTGVASIPVAEVQVDTGIPADTLRQRPDVREAEQRVHAQTARLGAAEAARYPSLRLSGSFGLEALSASGLGSSGAGTYSLLAGISAPVFDAGRLRSNVAMQDAVLEQARLDYQSAVLLALEDVENALVSLSNTRQRQQELVKAVESAREGWQLTQHQYAAGLINFDRVLDSQRSLLSLEDLLASNAGEYSNAQIRLYKALGGGWETDEEQKNKDDKTGKNATRNKETR